MWGCAYALYPDLREYPDLQTKIVDALRCTLADILQELLRTLYLLKLDVAEHLLQKGRISAEVEKTIILVTQGYEDSYKESAKTRKQ